MSSPPVGGPVGAAVCPSTLLLLPGVSGRRDPIAELRQAAADSLAAVLALQPARIVIVGVDPRATADPGPAAISPGDLSAAETAARSAVAPRAGEEAPAGPGAAPPLALAVGAALVREQGWSGPVAWWPLPGSSRPVVAAAAGALDGAAVLVLGTGSARSTARAPGSLHPAAEEFNRQLLAALAGWDVAGLDRCAGSAADQWSDLPAALGVLVAATAGDPMDVTLRWQGVLAGVLCCAGTVVPHPRR